MNMPHIERRSLWIDTTPETDYPELDGGLTVDVAVVGGGITGLTTAMVLTHSGASIALLEARRIALGTTGNTTAKITALHGLTYDTLINKHGVEAANIYGQANQVALEFIANLVTDQAIECDFARMPAFTYTEVPDRVSKIEAEVEASRRLGLPASYVDRTSLPFPVAAAIRFDRQALFHPRKYCIALAGLIEKGGGRIFEQTRAVDVTETEAGVEVATAHGAVVRAKQVVIATLLPFHDPARLFAKTHPSRSYAMSARVAGAVDGMYLGIDDPGRSVRPHVSPDGPMLVIGGEEHKTGQEPETEARYAAVESWARDRFDVSAIEHRWSAQDYMPADGIPYVGATGSSRKTLVAAGFKKWGMTNGTAAALMLSDIILGRTNEWLSVFDPTRLSLGASAASLAKENLDVAGRFVGGRLPHGAPSLEDLAPGDGAVVDHDGEKVAAYNDPTRGISALSARCTHMGCIVDFNRAERTWDCPCHGSRFDVYGQVLEGPATRPLEAKPIAQRET